MIVLFAYFVKWVQCVNIYVDFHLIESLQSLLNSRLIDNIIRVFKNSSFSSCHLEGKIRGLRLRIEFLLWILLNDQLWWNLPNGNGEYSGVFLFFFFLAVVISFAFIIENLLIETYTKRLHTYIYLELPVFVSFVCALRLRLRLHFVFPLWVSL